MAPDSGRRPGEVGLLSLAEGSTVTPKQLVLVVAATVGVLALVLLSIDWRPAALQDPARTLGFLNAQGVIRWGEYPNRAPFSALELSLFIAVGLAFVLAGVTAWHTRPNRNPSRIARLTQATACQVPSASLRAARISPRSSSAMA